MNEYRVRVRLELLYKLAQDNGGRGEALRAALGDVVEAEMADDRLWLEFIYSAVNERKAA